MNNILNYVTDPEFLQKWFKLQKTELWNLYRGFHSKVPERDVIHKQQDSTMTLDASWDLLWMMIMNSSVGGGKFTVYIPAFAGNKAVTQHFGVGLSAAPAWQSPSVAGMPGMQGMQQGYGMDAAIEKAIVNEREKWDKDLRIRELEAAQGARSNFMDVLLEKLSEMDIDTIMPVAIQGITNLFQPRPGVQLHGMPEDYQQYQQHYPHHHAPVQQPPVQQGPPPPPGEQPGGEVQYVYQTEVLIPWLNSIRMRFNSDEEFWLFMNALSTKFNAAPEMYKAMILPPNQPTNG